MMGMSWFFLKSGATAYLSRSFFLAESIILGPSRFIVSEDTCVGAGLDRYGLSLDI